MVALKFFRLDEIVFVDESRFGHSRIFWSSGYAGRPQDTGRIRVIYARQEIHTFLASETLDIDEDPVERGATVKAILALVRSLAGEYANFSVNNVDE